MIIQIIPKITLEKQENHLQHTSIEIKLNQLAKTKLV